MLFCCVSCVSRIVKVVISIIYGVYLWDCVSWIIVGFSVVGSGCVYRLFV